MTLGVRVLAALKRARLSPRNLGGATRIHHATIYRTIGGDNEASPLVERTLTDALDAIDKLVDSGQLPMHGKLSHKEKTDRLTALLSNK